MFAHINLVEPARLIFPSFGRLNYSKNVSKPLRGSARFPYVDFRIMSSKHNMSPAPIDTMTVFLAKEGP